jgi:bisphosphoglycerate-dependent phosphoglycerate mutase
MIPPPYSLKINQLSILDMSIRKLIDQCRNIFPEREGDRKCPECEKNTQGIKWEPWMGNLKDHLMAHYRVIYYTERAKTNEKYRKSKYCPWSKDYDITPRERLERYMDKDLFEAYFRIKKRKEEEEKEREREEQVKKVANRTKLNAF